MGLAIVGRASAHHYTLNNAISDLEIVQTEAGLKLISVSGPEGGIASFQVRSGTTPTIQDQAFFVANQISGTGHDILVVQEGETTRIQITGAATDAVLSYDLAGNGDLSDFIAQTGGSFGSITAVGARTEGGKLILADPSKSGFSVFDATGTGTITAEVKIADTDTTFAASVGDIQAVRINGKDIAIVAGQTEFGVTSYEIDGNRVTAQASIGPDDGLGIMVPMDVEITSVGGKTFAIVASNPTDGAIGALSVLEIGASGELTPVDHILDTNLSRFGGAQKLAAVSSDGHSYIVVGGSDGGLTLLELLDNGQLVHLDSISGTIDAPLKDITALEIAVVGDELQIFAASEHSAGITILSYDLRARGDAITSGAGGQTTRGTDLDDVILDGQGSDTLYGGRGSDAFVFATDGVVDRVQDFNIEDDRLDLSGLSFLYDVNSLNIEQTSNGARITHRGETLILVSHDGAPLTPQDVRNAIDIEINRSFLPPSVQLTGTADNERLIGSWGVDTLHGQDGDDTLEGLEGSDSLNGGAGNDLIHGGGGDDTLVGFEGEDSVFSGDGDDSLSGGSGRDHLYGELGNDTLDGGLGDDRLEGGDGNDILHSSEGQDTVWGGLGNDQLIGGEGNDSLSGQHGDDSLFGDTGHDMMEGGVGRDSVIGGNGRDTLLGGEGHDTLSGSKGRDLIIGDRGKDKVSGGNGGDTLNGGGGRDEIDGGRQNDEIRGGAGADTLRGGGGNDTAHAGGGKDKLFGGNGDDRLVGGAGQDLLSGGRGQDTLDGGASNDRLTGRQGADTFVFRKHSDQDVITDFNPNADKLLLDNRFNASGLSKDAFVRTYAEKVGNAIEFDFGGGDKLILSGFTRIDDLPDLIWFT